MMVKNPERKNERRNVALGHRCSCNAKVEKSVIQTNRIVAFGNGYDSWSTK